MNGNNNQESPQRSLSDTPFDQKKGDKKMTKPTNENTKNIFAVCKKSFDKIQGNVDRAAPQYLQSFTNIQQEYFAAWKNFIHSTIAVQQQYADKVGFDASAPELITKVVDDTTDEVSKAFDVQNKIVTTVLDAAKQNIKTINENATAFAELNQNIVNSCISVWNTKQ